MIPHNDEIEKMMIGLALLDKRLGYEAKALSTVDFYNPLHQRIWSIICELDEDNEPLEIAEIHHRLKSDTVRMSEIAQMAIGIPVQLSVAKEIKILKGLSALRTLQKGFTELCDRIERKADIDTILRDSENLVASVQIEQDLVVGTSKSLTEIFEGDVFPRLDRFVSGELVKVPFGWDALDKSTNGGTALGELVVLGAKPKSGKSGLMLQIARQQAERGIGCYMCSREMLNYENGMRIITQTSEFTANHMRPNLYAETARRMKDHARGINLPLHCDDKAKSVADIRKELQRLEDNGHDITSVFVDYVQLLKGNSQGNRAEVLEEIIYELKDLALEKEKAVFCNAQFNRDGIDAIRPSMSDFKGSSAIEMAGNLILLWTLEQDINPVYGARTGQLWIEAGRNVPYDEFDIKFYGENAFFELT